MALYKTPVFAASQLATRYAERTAGYPAGAPVLEQFSPACYEILRGVAVNTDITQTNVTSSSLPIYIQ
jgi:hypothetical protein